MNDKHIETKNSFFLTHYINQIGKQLAHSHLQSGCYGLESLVGSCQLETDPEPDHISEDWRIL